MQETLHDHHTAHGPLVDYINLMGSSNGELQDLTNRLVDGAVVYGIEVSTEKSNFVDCRREFDRVWHALMQACGKFSEAST